MLSMVKDKASYIEEAMEINRELSENWCKLKKLSPRKLEEIAINMDKPILEGIIARTLLTAWKNGMPLERLFDRISPMSLYLNLKTLTHDFGNPYAALNDEQKK